MSGETRLSALNEVAGGRGNVRELRRVLDDPPGQVTPARCFVLLVTAAPGSLEVSAPDSGARNRVRASHSPDAGESCLIGVFGVSRGG